MSKHYIILFLGDLNVLLFFFFIILGGLLINANTGLHLLLTAELLWITLYLISLLVGIAYDNLNILSLTFFVLIFSAIELGVGLVLLLLQYILLRTLGLDYQETNHFKMVVRAAEHANLNRLVWRL